MGRDTYLAYTDKNGNIKEDSVIQTALVNSRAAVGRQFCWEFSIGNLQSFLLDAASFHTDVSLLTICFFTSVC